MKLSPIFPPNERKYSAEELRQAADILDPETRELLAIDRARLLQSSAASAIALSKQIGLPEEVSRELSEAVLRSSAELPPAYHEYFNTLLSAMVELYSGGETSEIVYSKEIEVIADDKRPHSADDLPEYAGPPIMLAGTERLFRHNDRSSRPMRRFLRDIIKSDLLDIDSLTADEASLVTWQIMDYYNRFPLPQATPERKAKHIERITKLVGLYSPPITINEMAQSAGEAGSASIGITIKGAKNKLGPIIEPNVTNMVARARKTLKNQPPETLFAPTWKTIVAAETEEPDELRFQDTDRIGHSVLVDDLQPELSGSARRSTVHS